MGRHHRSIAHAHVVAVCCGLSGGHCAVPEDGEGRCKPENDQGIGRRPVYKRLIEPEIQ